MDEVSLNSEPIYEDEADEYEIEGERGITDFVGQADLVQGDSLLPPTVGMEFETYEDVYFFYNCYAKEQGFGVRVSNTWYRKNKERYRAKLSCSSAGFKKKSEANRPRPETRTGCPAMITSRLMDSKRWRIIEVKLEHNHLISPTNGKHYKSYKNLGVGIKRQLHDSAEEVQQLRLFRTVIVDGEGNGSTDTEEGEIGIIGECSSQLKLKRGDADALHNYFCHMQSINSNFFYVMDLNEKGFLRSVFWVDARSRAAYKYFNDVLLVDTVCLTKNYEVPLVAFIGVNHHGQPILLGSGLLGGKTLESFIWLFRAWLTCMRGYPPQVIITDQCQTLQAAVADVFPRASHCFCISHIMQKVSEKLEELDEYDAIRMAMHRAVYSLSVHEFEAAWEDMLHHHQIGDSEWLQTLFEDRKRWVPVYLKETFLVGIFFMWPSEHAASFLDGFLHKHTTLKEFLDKYDRAVQVSYKEEALSDNLSKNSIFMLKSSYYFEYQLSKLYTNDIFKKFQDEVVGLYSCFSARQANVDGPNITYIVREHVEVDENRSKTVDYEVMFNTSELDVLCICGLFNFKGYLCRHALYVLHQNGVEEIPSQYILRRWRKDVKRTYVLDHGCSGIDVNIAIHRYDQLHRCMMQVVEEGWQSQDRYKVAVQALDKILNNLHLVEDQPL